MVSDTENHLLRVVDLETKMVSTLAGTGEQGPPGGKASGPLLETPLNSPCQLHRSAKLFTSLWQDRIRSGRTKSALLRSAFLQVLVAKMS